MTKVQWQAPALMTGGGMMFKRVCAAAVCFAVVFISTAPIPVGGFPIQGPDFSTCTPVIPKEVIGDEETVDCCMIDTGKPAKHFEFNLDLPLRVRRPAHKLDEEYIHKYERAVELMRALPPEDPRSHRAQANIHGAYCEGVYRAFNSTNSDYLGVHNSWFFFPFHRWYVYFHERILASLIDDDTFALPYWAWDVQLEDSPPANVIPAAYLRKNSSLYDENRSQSHVPPRRADLESFSGWKPDIIKPDDVLVDNNMNIMWQMMIGNVKVPETFYYGKYSLNHREKVNSPVERSAHFAVHKWVGDPEKGYADMSPAWSAARDPIFFAHHAQMDRLWVLWKSWGGRDLDDYDWLNAEFVLYDEKAELVRVNVRDSLNLDNLRVTYELVEPDWVDYKPRSIRDIDPRYVKAGILKRFLRQMLVGETYTNIANAVKGYFQPDKYGAKVSFGGDKRAVVTSQVSMPEVIKTRSAVSSLYEDVVVIAGVVEKPFDVDVDFHMFLELPEADENTPRNCVEFLGTMTVEGSSNRMHPTVVEEFRTSIGIGERLQILNSIGQKSVTITFVPAWDPKYDSDVTVRVTDLVVERMRAR